MHMEQSLLGKWKYYGGEGSDMSSLQGDQSLEKLEADRLQVNEGITLKFVM